MENRRCDYLIEAAMGKAIILEFIDFDIEDNSGGSCDFDFIEVYLHFQHYFFTNFDHLFVI